MASISGSMRQLKELNLSDTSCTRGSDEAEYLTAPASEADHATSSSSFVSAENESVVRRGQCSGTRSVEERIEQSKSHWSLLADSGSSDDDEVAEVSNAQVFKALKMHPAWCIFLAIFGDGDDDYGKLVVGKKFAEGGQAELYDAQVYWNPERNQDDLKEGCGYVLKVFKKGTFLKHLKSQMPHRLLQLHAEDVRNIVSSTPEVHPSFYCKVHCGTLLEDGRFAFLMEKEHGDLRNLIERNMQLRSGKDCGPFLEVEAEHIMHSIALGMDWLHNHNIVHRDLKASNVLVRFRNDYPKLNISIADFECSIGVVGTIFFRAPEILQACKDHKLRERPEVFSKAADVYSYGMTCYEILTGEYPFEGHCANEYDFVLNGQRPAIPKYVEGWIHELLSRCWQSDPRARPTFARILNLLSEHSVAAKTHEYLLKWRFGKKFIVSSR